MLRQGHNKWELEQKVPAEDPFCRCSSVMEWYIWLLIGSAVGVVLGIGCALLVWCWVASCKKRSKYEELKTMEDVEGDEA